MILCCYGFMLSADLRLAFSSAQCAVVEIKQYIGMIHETVHDCGQNESGHHVKQRVLFDENS